MNTVERGCATRKVDVNTNLLRGGGKAKVYARRRGQPKRTKCSRIENFLFAYVLYGRHIIC